MKIALCYSGNLRTYEYCVVNHSSLLKEADIYISTWDNFGFIDRINDPMHYKIQLDVQDKVTEDYILEKTPSNFNIKSIKIEKYDTSIIKNIKKYNELSYQYYKIKDSFTLLVNSGIEYDFIVRIRPDITITNFRFIKDKIVCENNIWYNNPHTCDKQSMNEMIWVSNYELMSKSIKIYDNLQSISDNISEDMCYGESICFQNFKMMNLMKDMELHNFGYNVIR